jgi:LysM repeat protein
MHPRRHDVENPMILRTTRMALVLLCAGLLSGCSLFDWSDKTAPPVVGNTFTPVPAKPAFYVKVEHGQSLDQIAKTYRVPKRRIVVANKLKSPFRLKPGSEIEIPLDSPPSTLASAAHAKGKKVQGWTVVTNVKHRKTPPEPRQAKAKQQGPKIIALDDPT